MAAKAKELTKQTIDEDKFKAIRAKANKVIEAAKACKVLTEFISANKTEINTVCREIFLQDLENGSINGNHIFSGPKGTMTINFKLMAKADITQYKRTLVSYLGERYVDLFMEEIEFEPSSEEEFCEQIHEHPELFSLTMKPGVTMKELLKVYKTFPQLFTIRVRDKKRYAEVYPDLVEETKKVYPINGFIAKLGKIESTLMKRVINVLRKFFEDNLDSAIKIE